MAPRRLTFLITGCSSGFGLALTHLALQHRHAVLATVRDPGLHAPLAALLADHPPSQLLALDLDDPDRAADLVRDLEERQRLDIDVLVNNAGWSLLGPAETFAEPEVRRQLETLFFGPYRLLRAVVPGMRRRRGGVLVNISSGAAVDGREGMAVYGAGKAAMDALMRVTAKELAPFGVRTLTVLLGGFDTSFTYSLTRVEAPFPDDYAGSMVERVLRSIEGSNFQPDGDHKKAAQAIFDVIVGEGVGESKEGERILPLGRDMGKLMDRTTDAMRHSMETFRYVCDNVHREV